MPFNPETLYLASGVSRCTFLVIFLATVFSQPDERCLRHWLVALAASAAGSLCMALSPSYPIAPLPLWLVTTTLFFASLTLSWSGLRIFYQRRVNAGALVLISVTPAVLLSALSWLNAPEAMKLSTVFFMTSVMTALAVAEIFRPPRKRILSQYVVALAFGVYFLALFIPLVMLITGAMSVEMMVSGQAAIMADQVLCILIYFGFIAMTGERSSIELKRLSETDQLTGLANRRAVQGILKQQNAHWGGPISSVIIIDLDHFKSVNDRLGHDAGDSVLKDFSRHLRAITRQQDMPVRWGGEEFLLLLPDTRLEEAAVMAERLRHRVATTPFLSGQHTLNVTISLGVAERASADKNDFASMLQNADEALYRAKHEGRNRVCRYDAALGTPLSNEA